MVARTQLPGSGLDVSRLGLGLSHLHRVASPARRLRLLEEAYALGFTHFDTARMYGDGMAERALGRFGSKRRDEITVATKFGLTGSDWIGALGDFGVPLRAGRSLLHRRGLVTWPTQDYTADQMRRSLNRSLTALRTDYVDILFVHEPPMAIAGSLNRLLDAIHAECALGRVRLVGLSGSNAGVLASQNLGLVDVVQTPEAAVGENGPVPDVTYSALASSSTLGPAGALRHALSRRPSGAVLVRSSRASHLAELAAEAAL